MLLSFFVLLSNQEKYNVIRAIISGYSVVRTRHQFPMEPFSILFPSVFRLSDRLSHLVAESSVSLRRMNENVDLHYLHARNTIELTVPALADKGPTRSAQRCIEHRID